MTYYRVLMCVLLITAQPSTLYARMYKWVDENGKVSYSNMVPPSSAHKVETSGETIETASERAVRIENEQIQSKRNADLGKYRKEQRRILRVEQNRIASEISRSKRTTVEHQARLTEAQQKMLDDMARRRFTAPGFSGDGRKARIHSQEVKNQREIDRLRAQFLGVNNREERGQGSIRHSNIEGRTNINGEWDTQGRHYTPAGGGNTWRDDGTFMQKAAGGYIDTKTGQYVPAN